MLNKKAMIYPVDRESIPLIRNNSLLEEYDIMYVVSPKGWKITGKDCGILDGGSKINKIITDDFDKTLELIDCVIFTESELELDFEKMIFPKIKKAINADKDVVCTLKIPDNFIEELTNLTKNGKFKYYQKEKIVNFKPIENEYIYDINVPIMGFFSQTERSGKFDTQLAIRQRLIEKGYKVSQIGTRHYSELFGFHSFPKFMTSSNISESNKIMLFNHYVKKIEIEEKPDIILIGVPGGTMVYSNDYTNRFGILAFEVCNAIQFDSIVLNVLYNNYTEEYFNVMKESLKYRLGIEIDVYNIAPLKGYFEYLDDKNDFGYLTLNNDFVDNKIKAFNNLNCKICNALSDKSKDETFDYLMNKLISYSDIEAV